MKLAKPHLDIGLFTANIAAHDAFWGEAVGLRLDHKLPVGNGWVQHRYDAHNSVVKVVSRLPAKARAAGKANIPTAGGCAWCRRAPTAWRKSASR